MYLVINMFSLIGHFFRVFLTGNYLLHIATEKKSVSFINIDYFVFIYLSVIWSFILY